MENSGWTILLRVGVNPLSDPALVYYLIQQFLLNRFLDAVIRWLIFVVLWKPRDNAPSRVFSTSVALGLKQKELEQQSTAFREYFFKKNKKWLLSNLKEIFTPRSIQRYRPQLGAVYERLLNLQPPFQYKVPVVSAAEGAGSRRQFVGAGALGNRGEEDPGMMEAPLDEEEETQLAKTLQDAGVEDVRSNRQKDVELEAEKKRVKEYERIMKSMPDLPSNVTRLSWAMCRAWHRLARQNRESQLATRQPLMIDTGEDSKHENTDSDEVASEPSSQSEPGEVRVPETEEAVFPDWAVVRVNKTTREIILSWVRMAQKKLKK